MPGLPEVSLITSWHAGAPGEAEQLPGLVYALRAGLGLIDLYFLDHSEIAWYSNLLKWDQSRLMPASGLPCPLIFAASLEPPDIETIANALLDLLIKEYSGRLVGPRPRFTALATYWPLIIDDDPEKRNLSIRAIQNSVLLAEKLGCRHVEVVGGFAFSGADGKGFSAKQDREALSRRVREGRLELLKNSLEAVFEDRRGQLLLSRQKFPDQRNTCLCLEIEPGSAYLINSVEQFHSLHQKLHPAVAGRVLLNVDLAHMFLAESDAGGRFAGEKQWNYIRDHHLQPLIGHFHCSDHARTHASDLCPGTYHFLSPDYTDWLRLAAELSGQPQFSGVLAIEMEACSDVHEILRAVGRTNAWVRIVASTPSPDAHTAMTGVIMAVDIVKSTAVLALEGTNLEAGARRIDTAVSAICRTIQRHRGSVYSFTGDGVVAAFDTLHFNNTGECVTESIDAACKLFSAMRDALKERKEWGMEEEKKLALRITLHSGRVMVPTHGPLRHQAIGRDVIIACRLLNAVKMRGGTGLVLSKGVYESLAEVQAARCQMIPDQKIKGIHWATLRTDVKALYSMDCRPND